jgi:septal ring factor EnvC (AmiA/AmiB activator)
LCCCIWQANEGLEEKLRQCFITIEHLNDAIKEVPQLRTECQQERARSKEAVAVLEKQLRDWKAQTEQAKGELLRVTKVIR